ncbi:hypothetical protein [Paraburkholderia sp. BR10923]|uniref:hypothetical protein n=1 Tax=Paraburkholderia TaxID=1822464 RepID=UPI0034D00ACF
MAREVLGDRPQISPRSLGNAEAITTMVNNLIGGTTAVADAAAQMSQAAQAGDPLVALWQRLASGMDIIGSGLSTLQTFQ